MQQRAVTLNTEYLLSYNANYWRFQAVDNIEKNVRFKRIISLF